MADSKELFKWDSGQKDSAPLTDLIVDTITFDAANRDVIIHRDSASTIGISGGLNIDSSLVVYGSFSLYNSTGKIRFGDGLGAFDTNLYRGAAQIVQTDYSLRVNVGLVVGDITTVPVNDQIIAAGAIQGLEFIGTGQGATYGLTLGTDTQIYRGAANVLDTPDSLRVGVGLVVGDNTTVPVTDQIIAAGAIQGLELIGTGQGSTYGLTLGSDTQIYRGAANVLDTPDSLRVGVGLVVGDNATTAVAGKIIADFAALSTDGSGGGIALGTDTQIYRGAANVLDTPDSLRVGVGLVVGSNTPTPVSGVITIPGIATPTAPTAAYGHIYMATAQKYPVWFDEYGYDTPMFQYAYNVPLFGGVRNAGCTEVQVGNIKVLQFADSTTSLVEWSFEPPRSWKPRNLYCSIWWAPAVATAGNVRIIGEVRTHRSGTNIDTVYLGGLASTFASPAITNRLTKQTFMVTTMNSANYTIGDALHFTLYRAGSDALDTLAGAIYITAVNLAIL